MPSRGLTRLALFTLTLMSVSVGACVLPHANLRIPATSDADVSVVAVDERITELDGDVVDVMDLDIPTPLDMDAEVATADMPTDMRGDSSIVDSIDIIDASDVGTTDVPNPVCGMGMFNCGGGCRRVEAMISTCGDARNDGVYVLTVGGTPWCATCRAFGMGEKWTMLLRANGAPTESPQPQRFGYDSPLWTNEETYNPEGVTLDDHDYKARGFMVLPFKEILVQMWTPVDTMMPRSLSGSLADRMAPAVSSLRSIFVNPARQNPMMWDDGNVLGLVPGSSLQGLCRRVGFNVRANDNGRARVRIGAIGNENVIDSCNTHDSWIGVGGWLGDGQSFSAGNVTESCVFCEQVTRSRAVVWVR